MSIQERIEELRTTMGELDALYARRDEVMREMNAMMIRENELMSKIHRINIDIVKEG